MSNFLRHTQCPRCATAGKDKNGNNLGVYADGSVFCFSCGYRRSAKGIERLKAATSARTTTLESQICLPGDVEFSIPQRAWDFLGQYQLTKEDVNEHRIMWSEQWQRLIFPYFDGERLCGWQGRYLGDPHPVGKNPAKWFSQGNLQDLLHICGQNSKNADQCGIVLVEDIISAIKVGHMYPASPLFGSHLSTKQAVRYAVFFTDLILWLDFDKATYSMSKSQHLRDLNLVSRSVITEKDPKEYSEKEIQKFLDN